MSASEAANRILDGLAAICTTVAGILLVVLIAIFGWLVFGRYVLNDTPTWVEQASLLIVAYITFLGAAAGVRRGAHLSVAFIRESLPRGPRVALEVVSALIMSAFGGAMAWQGSLLVAATTDRVIPMIALSEGWRALPVPICGTLIALFSLASLTSLIRGGDRG